MAEFFNQAAVSFSGGTVLSNITVGRLLDTLTLEKTALRQTYRAGDRVTYAVSLANTGETALTGLTVTDDLGAYAFGGETLTPLTPTEGAVLVYVDGALQPDVAVIYGETLTVGGLELPAGGDLVLLYETTVNGFAPLGPTGPSPTPSPSRSIRTVIPTSSSGALSPMCSPSPRRSEISCGSWIMWRISPSSTLGIM